MPWTVEFHDDFEREFQVFEPAVQDALLAVAKLLADFGPQLGRPYADTLNGSKYANMKELRFEASDGEWRAAFCIRSTAASDFCWSPATNPAVVRNAFTGSSLQRRTSDFPRTWIA